MSDEVRELTPRQREMLVLVAEGMTIPEIAAHLFLSEHTVKTHLREAQNRLAARTRAHAIAIAFRLGLLA